MVEVHRTLQEQHISHNLTLPLLSVSLGFSYMLLEIASVMLSLSSRCIWKARWLSLSLVLLLLCSNASCRHYCALGDGHLLEPSEMD